MDLYDLTVNQLKRAVAIKERIEKLSRSSAASSVCQATLQVTRRKADHERVREKEDCGCAKSEMGEPSSSQTSNAFRQNRCQSQENDI